MNKKTVEIAVGYFKKGDDHSHCASITSTPSEAFVTHATFLDQDANILAAVGEILEGVEGVEVFADTHVIQVTAPAEVAERLVSANLAYFPDWLEEWDEEQEDFY